MSKRGSSPAFDDSFTRPENLAVLHVIQGQEVAEDLHIHISLAFVHRIRMPYFPYELVRVHRSKLQKIQKIGHLIGLETQAAQRLGLSPAEGTLLSSNLRVRQLAEAHDAELRGIPRASPGQSVLELIREKGREVVELLEFEAVFDILLELSKARLISQLHIVTDLENVPWDWMYRDGKFLSDLFGIGLSSRRKTFNEAKKVLVPDIRRLHGGGTSRSNSVLHFFCRYQRDEHSPLRPFARMGLLHATLQRVLQPVFGDRIFGIEVENVSQIKNALEQYQADVQLIVFSGHYEEEGFVFEGEYTKRHFGSKDVPDIALKKRPIVIFGGCATEASGLGPSTTSMLGPFITRMVEGRETLPDKFFESGASACVVTSAALRYPHYEEILPLLVAQLAKSNKVSIGNAVSSVRNSIQGSQGRRPKSDSEDLLVALYQLHVLGDPTATIW